MNKKIFLTSAIVFGLCCPAFAEYPDDDYFLENQTYENAATYGNLGAYSGTVNATANYEDIKYFIYGSCYWPTDLGFETERWDWYLGSPEDGGCPAVCPAGSYCPTDDDFAYGETTIYSCSDVGDGTYTLSEPGSGIEGRCYKACTTANLNDAHATAADGRIYFSGQQTCVATACETGYGVLKGKCARNCTTSDLANSSTISTVTGVYISEFENNCAISVCANGYSPVKVLKDYITTAPTDIRYKAINGNSLYSLNASSLSYGQWQINWNGAAIVNGMGVCSSTEGAYVYGLGNPDTTSTGRYCWCRMDNYQIPWNAATVNVVSPVSVYKADESSSDTCETSCPRDCMSFAGERESFLSALFGTLGNDIAYCNPNTITINWSDASAADIAANNAGQCTFGGDIRTPAAAATKTGKRFLGWTFQKAN